MADLHALTQTLSDTLRRADMTVNWLQPVLLRLVARGEPVTVANIAATCGRPVAEVQAALSQMPDTELDDAGRVVCGGSPNARPRTSSRSTAGTCSRGAPWTR